MASSVPFVSPNGGPSIFPVALLVAVAVFFVLVAVVGIFVVVVVANRGDPDPTGRRPFSVYLFAVSFFTIFAVLFGTFGIVQSVVQLIGTNSGGNGAALHPLGDAVARGASLSGIITGVALIVLVFHLRRGVAIAGRADPRLGPLGRVAQSYVAAVSFLTIVIAVIALVFALYEVVRIIAPGVYQVSGTRTQTLRPLISSAYLALAALVILFLHLRLVPPDIRRGRWRAAEPTPPTPAPATPMARAAAPPVDPAPPAAPSSVVAPVTAAPEPPDSRPGVPRSDPPAPPAGPASGRPEPPPFTPPRPPFDPRPDPPGFGSPPPTT